MLQLLSSCSHFLEFETNMCLHRFVMKKEARMERSLLNCIKLLNLFLLGPVFHTN